jgi:hypothetical protein
MLKIIKYFTKNFICLIKNIILYKLRGNEIYLYKYNRTEGIINIVRSDDEILKIDYEYIQFK